MHRDVFIYYNHSYTLVTNSQLNQNITMINIFPAGNYVVPFKFVLKAQLPGSFDLSSNLKQNDSNHNEKE